MKRILLSLVLVLAASFVSNAQATAPDAPEVTRLLHEFLAAASRNDVAGHDRFWAEDLIYTRGSGSRVGKADIMKSVRSSPASHSRSKVRSSF